MKGIGLLLLLFASTASAAAAPTADQDVVRSKGIALVEQLRARLEGKGLNDAEISITLDAVQKSLEGYELRGSYSGLSIDPVLAARLSPEQIERLMRIREEGLSVRSQIAHEVPAIAIVIPIGAFGFFLTLVAMTLFFRNRSERERQETLRRMVEKGVEIPPGLVASEQKSMSDARRGVILVFAGAGIGMFLRVVDPGEQGWSLSIVPAMIGFGYLAAHWLENKLEQPL